MTRSSITTDLAWCPGCPRHPRTFVDTPDDEMTELRRTAVRVVLADAAGQILLLHVVEPKYPELGDCGELSGGGIDPGEDLFMAAQRELAEETGLRVPITDIATPSWFRSVTFLHAGARRVQDEAIAYAAIPGLGPPVQATALSADENEIYLGYRWWAVDDIESSDVRFFPTSLPRVLRQFLAGKRIEEPFERFS